MYNNYRMYPYPYYGYRSSYDPYDPYNIYNPYFQYQYSYFPYDPYIDYVDEPDSNSSFVSPRLDMSNDQIVLKDYGPQPFVVNIDEATKQNNTFRTALWTGSHLQVTLMSINVGDDIGLEVHPNTDQFIRIEDGQGLVQMGMNKNNLDFQANASDDFAIMIPAGMWHNIINTGNKPLKVYAIYAPPEHSHSVVHVTKPAE